jgi:peptidoglycan/xylan/chitin deacetylase (PgdA/CDA1 family)
MVSVKTFAAQMQALTDAGYHTVSFADLQSYVENGTALPENPVVVTFDDGYESNYTLAYPILQQYQMKATIFAIGVSVGKTTYKDTGEAMLPHFSAEEALEMEASGLIEVESHGYDIHEVEGRDTSPIRVGVLQRDDESEEDYVAFLQKDCQQMAQALSTSIGVLAYPYGQYSELSEVVLSQAGIYATVTTEARTNTVVQGLPQSLHQMGRYRVTDDMTAEDLLALLEN